MNFNSFLHVYGGEIEIKRTIDGGVIIYVRDGERAGTLEISVNNWANNEVVPLPLRMTQEAERAA